MKRLLAIFLMLFPCVALGDMQFFGGGGGGVTAPVSVANGGTGAAPSGDDQILVSNSSSAATWRTIGDCVGTGKAITYTAATNAWGCNTITAGIAGSTGATDNAVLRADGTGGATLQNSPLIVGDAGETSGISTLLATGRVTFGSAVDAANAVDINAVAGQITFEGSVVDGSETHIAAANATAGDQTWTIPNAGSAVSRTFASLEAQQTFSGGTTMSSTSGFTSNTYFCMATGNNFPCLFYANALTPDSLDLALSTTARSVHIIEGGDEGFDFNNGPCGTSACTNPNLIVHAATQDTTNYQALNDSGLNGSFRKTLTESSATTIAQITVPAASGVSGQLLYTVFAKDGTNSQVRSGRILYSVVAEGTTATCVLGTPEEIDNTPTGTLTATITCDTATANLAKLQINAVSSLTQTTLESYGTIIHVGSGEMLPQ